MNAQTLKMKSSNCAVRARKTIVAAAAALFLLAGATFTAQSLTKQGQGTLTLGSSTVVGFVPGQTLRLGVSNPGRCCGAADGGGETVRAHVKVFDGAGNLLHQTEEAEIPEGRFHSFDVDRADVSAAGDTRTGRAEVRVELLVKAAPTREEAGNTYTGPTYINQGVLQLVSNDTGETEVALLLPAVQKVREAASR